MLTDNHIDELRKELMEQEGHQNFDQCYQSNLNEICFRLFNKTKDQCLLNSVFDIVKFCFLN